MAGTIDTLKTTHQVTNNTVPLNENITRHIGRITNTGSRIIVVFRSLPDDEDSALVVYSDSLPDFYHDNLMSVVESREAQQEVDLFDVLARNSFGDGNNILQTLHTRGFLAKVNVKDVNLLPMPNQPVPLKTVNEQIQLDKDLAAGTLKPKEAERKQKEISQREDAFLKEDDFENINEFAQHLITKAEELEDKAKELRNKAYTLNPDLKPKRGRPPAKRSTKEGKVAQKLVERKRENEIVYNRDIKNNKKNTESKESEPGC